MTKTINLYQYSFGEEVANSVIHGIGALFSIVGLTVLLVLAVQSGSTTHIVSYAVYGSSLIFLYLSSTLYHALPHKTAKRVFKTLDHIGIYLLIAGTYTPFLAIHVKGPEASTMLILIWLLALAGVIFKLFFTGRFRLLSTGLYIAMGWLIVFAYQPLSPYLTPKIMGWMLAGGLFYTGGTGAYLMKKIRYHHAMWHAFVIMGSVCHYIAVILAM